MSTTDPGNSDLIKEAANQADQGRSEEVTRDIVDSAEYWTWSTLCPLLAGTFGPMASAFSVCALVVSWREYIPPGSVEADSEPLTDPHWLVYLAYHRMLPLAYMLIDCHQCTVIGVCPAGQPGTAP